MSKRSNVKETAFAGGNREEYSERVADRINEFISTLRKICKGGTEAVSEEVREEAKVLARATLVFGGHLMDELGLRYEPSDEWAWKDGNVRVWTDGTVLYVDGEKTKALGNVKENASRIVSVIDKLSAGSIKGVDNDKSCRKGENDDANRHSRNGSSLNAYVNERVQIEKFFTEHGYVLSDVHTVENIEHCWVMDCICKTKGTHKMERFSLPIGWHSSAFDAECIKDRSSKYNGCWKIRLYVMCNKKAYSEFCFHNACANKLGMTFDEYLESER